MRRVVRDLRLDRSPAAVRASVEASPVAESDIVTITARDSDPRVAQAIANGVGVAAVKERTDALHEQLDDVIPRIRARVDETTDPATKEVLASRLADLQTLREMPDPTVRTATSAELPESPIAPRPMLSLVVALVAGLLVGVGGVVALQLLDPRIVSDDQLRDRYRLRILARLRRAKLARGGVDRGAVREFRALRDAILARDHAPGAHERIVVMIAPSSAEAKASAVNLAGSLAGTGRSVILAEADGGRPSLGVALGAHSEQGMVDVLRGKTSVEAAAAPAPEGLEGVALLLDGASGDRLSEVLDTRTAHMLVEDAARVSDWMVVASPPYARAIDVLPLARLAGHVVLIVHSGVTRTSQLRRLTDLLGDNGVEPAGFMILGARDADSSN